MTLFPGAAAVTPEQLERLLQGYRFPIGNELAFQNALARVLDEHGIAHERERHLGDAGTVDFYLAAERIGIELKVQGSQSAVARQLLRYARCSDVDALVLVTGRVRLGQLPPTLNGKPLTVVTLWEAAGL